MQLLDERSDAREILHGRHVCLVGFITDSGMDESRSYSDGGLSMCSVAMQSPSPPRRRRRLELVC